MSPAFRRISITCALLAALVLVFFLWKAKVDRDLDAAWRQTLGGASFLERYPKRDDNATVRELEGLGAEIGLGDAPWRGRPTAAAARRYAAATASLRELLDPLAQPEDGALRAPPHAVVAYLDFARPTLRRIVQVLRHDPPPVWRQDLALGFDAPVRNDLDSLALQKVLLAEAREKIRRGRLDEALAVLEASWRYNEAVQSHTPSLVPQWIGIAVLNLQQPVLRNLPAGSAASSTWRTRLGRIDVRHRVLVGLQAEVFRVHRAVALGQPLDDASLLDPPLRNLHNPWGRFLLWDHARRFEAMIQDLARHDVRSFDAVTFNDEQEKRLPRWQSVARFMQPNYWDVWGKAARTELYAELTARVLEERERLAAGGPPRAADRRPSRVPGLSWIYEDTPEGTRIYLDGDLACRVVRPVPLRFLVRRP